MQTKSIQRNMVVTPSLLRHVLILVPIVAFALVLRIYQLSDIDFRIDSASAQQQARRIAEGELLSYARYSGSVIEHPPVFLYIMALPFLITRDFLAAVGFHVLLDVSAIPVVYVAAVRQRWNAGALVAALLFATSPWCVQFARGLGIVVPPVVAALCLWGLLEGAAQRRSWGWALASVSAVLAVGAHWSGLYLIAVVAAVALTHRSQVSWRSLSLGLIPLALLGSAYAIGNGQAVLARTNGIGNVLGGMTTSLPWQPQAAAFALWTSGGMHLADLTGSSYATWVTDPLLVLSWIDTVQIGLLVLGLAIVCRIIPARFASRAPAHTILGIAWLMPVAMQTLSARTPAIHYMIPNLPSAMLLMGVAAQVIVTFAQTASPRVAKTASAALIGVVLMITGWQAYTNVRFANFSAEHPSVNRPPRGLLEIATLTQQTRARGLDEDIIVVTDGDDLPWNEAVVIADAVLSGVPHRFLNALNDGMIFRNSGSHYVFLPGTQRGFLRLKSLSGGLERST